MKAAVFCHGLTGLVGLCGVVSVNTCQSRPPVASPAGGGSWDPSPHPASTPRPICPTQDIRPQHPITKSASNHSLLAAPPSTCLLTLIGKFCCCSDNTNVILTNLIRHQNEDDNNDLKKVPLFSINITFRQDHESD